MGGVGFDISCGVRTMKTGLTKEEVLPRLERLVDQFYNRVPAGVGSEGLIRLSAPQIDEMLLGGAAWAVKKGYGVKEDLAYLEEHGRVDGADPSQVSSTAKKRQEREMGTLGRETIISRSRQWTRSMTRRRRRPWGSVRTEWSSRCTAAPGARHQIGTDSLRSLTNAAQRFKLPIRDRELASAPITSPEGRPISAP